ncbi:succinate dehydrogenase, cytochrome b556 subunit [Hyphomicrobium sp. CS1GBMeth3]|uniref:succinate dehydrogenase, cytochrome b556 subunit n=1 Tax=Hyphomicrobium sp. CS1GBMeth3 TaxID=1892845 RepID=UPI0009318ABF|nr:succinate dehydrogenase, cytochrome b556 subunit [Hyphomicrobium sp. CS1GBMeth3]
MAEANAKRGSQAARPLSPHLQIYRPEVNMVMSILHRLTGAALYFGTLIVVWVLVAAASGQEYFDYATGLLGTWPGLIILFGYTWALLNHLFGGIRHFIWDFGYGYDIEMIDLLSWATAAAAGALTILIWGYILFSGGGADL